MITLRRSQERGHMNHGWLVTYHTFSFGSYHDPAHMGFRTLRVINEDVVQAGQGFPAHPHQDMEILTYVLEGALEHKDSMGNGSVIRPGDLQRMSAGTGVVHSEYNASHTSPVHLLQIWILPDAQGLPPSYAQKHFSEEERTNRLCLLASPDGRDGSISLHQDAYLYGTLLEAGTSLTHPLAPGRHAWVQVAGGTVRLNGETLHPGDGAAVSDETVLTLSAQDPAEVLLFDLT